MGWEHHLKAMELNKLPHSTILMKLCFNSWAFLRSPGSWRGSDNVACTSLTSPLGILGSSSSTCALERGRRASRRVSNDVRCVAFAFIRPQFEKSCSGYLSITCSCMKRITFRPCSRIFLNLAIFRFRKLRCSWFTEFFVFFLSQHPLLLHFRAAYHYLMVVLWPTVVPAIPAL